MIFSKDNVNRFCLFLYISMIIRSWFFTMEVFNYNIYCYIVSVYSFFDLWFRKMDMKIHHIASICCALCGTYLRDNNYILTYEQDLYYRNILQTILDVEVSSLFLTLVYLGYKNIIIRLMFAGTFIYFRNYKLTKLVLNQNTHYFMEEYICKDKFCMNLWYFGIYTLTLLNWYWLYFIIEKAKKSIYKKNN